MKLLNRKSETKKDLREVKEVKESKDKAEQLVNFVRDMGVAEAVCKVLGE